MTSTEINESKQKNNNGKAFAGLLLVSFGTILLLKKMGYFVPDWLTSWPVLMICIGIFIGAKNGFRNPSAIIVTLIGLVFLSDKLLREMGISIGTFFWPIMIIAVGLYLILNKKSGKKRIDHWYDEGSYKSRNTDGYAADSIEAVAIFGGIHKVITSKDFKGGEVVCVLSGAEIDLSQASFTGKVVLEITNVLGGTKLIMPANWEVSSEIVAIFGGIEDKRPQNSTVQTGENLMIIRGTSVLGGIEIKSF